MQKVPAEPSIAPVLKVHMRYMSEKPVLPSTDETNGHDNLGREYVKGNIVIQGKAPDDVEIKAYANMSKEERDIVAQAALDRFTSDKALRKWIRYNAHFDGIPGLLIADIQKLLLPYELNPRMDPTKIRIWLDLGNNLNEFILKCEVGFKDLVYSPQDPDAELKVYSNEETDKSPVLTYSAIILVKNENGKIIATLLDESLIPNHTLVTEYIRAIEKRELQRHEFYVCRDALRDIINNKDHKVAINIDKKLAAIDDLIKKEPFEVNYMQLGSELLSYIAMLQNEYLKKPKNEEDAHLNGQLKKIISTYPMYSTFVKADKPSFLKTALKAAKAELLPKSIIHPEKKK